MSIKELIAKWREIARVARPLDVGKAIQPDQRKRAEEWINYTNRSNEVAAALENTVRAAFLEGYDAAGATQPGLGSPDEVGGNEAWKHSEAKADVEACYPKEQR